MNIVRLGLGLPCALLCAGCFGGSSKDDDTGGGGGEAGNDPPPLLETLSCEGLKGDYEVTSMDCLIGASFLWVIARRESDQMGSSDDLVAAQVDGVALGVTETEYGGSMSIAQPEPVHTRVSLGVCGSPSSAYTPSSCELEVLEIERGSVTTRDVEGNTLAFELGSSVRMRVSCPGGLYTAVYPGADDYGPSLRRLVPSEFLLEASDCRVPLPEDVPEPE